MDYIRVWSGRADRPDRGMLRPPLDDEGRVVHPKPAPLIIHREALLPTGPRRDTNHDELFNGPVVAKEGSRLADIKCHVLKSPGITRNQLIGWLMDVYHLDLPSARTAVHYAVKSNFLKTTKETPDATDSAQHHTDVGEEDELEELDW